MLLVVLVSLVTPPPGRAAIERYFPASAGSRPGVEPPLAAAR
jgi:hypothetical protein